MEKIWPNTAVREGTGRYGERPGTNMCSWGVVVFYVFSFCLVVAAVDGIKVARLFVVWNCFL